jgi:hypothetical protein
LLPANTFIRQASSRYGDSTRADPDGTTVIAAATGRQALGVIYATTPVALRTDGTAAIE